MSGNYPDDVNPADPAAPWNWPDEWRCAGCDNVFDWADAEPATERTVIATEESVATLETVYLCMVCATE